MIAEVDDFPTEKREPLTERPPLNPDAVYTRKQGALAVGLSVTTALAPGHTRRRLEACQLHSHHCSKPWVQRKSYQAVEKIPQNQGHTGCSASLPLSLGVGTASGEVSRQISRYSLRRSKIILRYGSHPAPFPNPISP
jgi:hypothetical protein